MASSLQFLKALASDIVPINSEKLTVIMSDFNLTKIDWSISCTVVNRTTADVKLLLFAQWGGFKQIVCDPMHDTNFTDLFFILQSNVITDVNIEMLFSTSDHYSVEVYMQSHAFVISDIPIELKEEMPQANRLDFDKTDHT